MQVARHQPSSDPGSTARSDHRGIPATRSRKYSSYRTALVGRGTRHAVLTVSSTVEYRDTEPTVNESDWMFCDLERLVAGGITEAQASVLRKTSKAMWKSIDHKPAPVAAPVVQTQKAQTIQMLVA